MVDAAIQSGIEDDLSYWISEGNGLFYKMGII